MIFIVDKKEKIKVAVLMGGPSSEYEVSLKSGENVLKCLDREKYHPEAILIDKNGQWPIEIEELKNFDLAFIAMHGPYGEDGTIQSLLESLKIPYNGSSSLTSALAMNKYLTSKVLKAHDLIVPPSFLVTKMEWEKIPSFIAYQIKHYFGYPVVIKPNNQGSSIGVSLVENEFGLTGAFNEIFSLTREAIIQPYIKGREVTCGVLDYGWPDSAYPLVPTEIIPKKSKIFDYQAKYEPGASKEITPAPLPSSLNKEIQKVALAVHKILGCSGVSRTDMILGEDKKIYVLETNTIPGMTETSLIPQQAAALGISFSQLLDRIISAALNKHRR